VGTSPFNRTAAGTVAGLLIAAALAAARRSPRRTTPTSSSRASRGLGWSQARPNPRPTASRTGWPRLGSIPPWHPRETVLSDHDAAVAEACRPVYAALHDRRLRVW